MAALTTPATRASRLRRPPRWLVRTFDVVIVVVLTVVAYRLRHGGLPTDGLWFDDSWVAAGALRGHLTEIMTVGSGQPGFTALLMAWHHLGSGSLRSLALPALAMGTITPAVLYLSLRSFGYRRAIAVLLASAAVVAGVDILYSGRVKPYTFDPVLILGIGVLLPWLARRTWRWPLAVGWVVFALLVGSFSGYVLVATAAAGVVLFLHPAGDRLVRGGALGAQALGQLVFYLWAQRSTDLEAVEEVIGQGSDAHLHLYANPFRFGSEILTHLGRVAWIYPGGGGAWLKVLGVIAVAGLIAASVRSPRRNELLPARYLLITFAAAVIGALLGKLPFGPVTNNFFSSSGRYDLWLLPSMAVGLAAALTRVRDLARDRVVLARAFDVALIVIAIVVLVQGYRDPIPYPFPGSASTTRYVEHQMGPHDVVLLPGPSMFAFADASRLPVTLRATPDRQVGFTIHFADPRVHSTGYWGEDEQTPSRVRELVGDASRVFVPADPLFGAGAAASIGKVLQADGYRPTTVKFGDDTVTVWQR